MNEFFIKALAPITAFLIVAASWIVSVIYRRGAFNAESVQMTAMAVIGFSTMMITSPITGALGNIYIAKKRTWRLTFLSLPFILLNAYMDWVLMGPFKQGGIAASSSVVSFAWMIVLLIDLKYKFKISKLFSAKTILPLITSVIYVWLFVSPLAGLHSSEKLVLEILIAGVMVLFFTRNEARMILKRITRK
jgi:putative peptidoglycan lipid II flippase